MNRIAFVQCAFAAVIACASHFVSTILLFCIYNLIFRFVINFSASKTSDCFVCSDNLVSVLFHFISIRNYECNKLRKLIEKLSVGLCVTSSPCLSHTNFRSFFRFSCLIMHVCVCVCAIIYETWYIYILKYTERS